MTDILSLPAAHHYACKNASTSCDPIVLLHGWGCDSTSWSPIISVLQEFAHIIAIDLPGFGASPEIDAFTLDAVTELLAAQLPPSCVLVGWSLGGMLAVQLAARYPEKISKIITLAANVKFVASRDYSSAMPLAVNRQFNAGFAVEPESTLKLFCGLLAQGDANERALLKQVRKLAAPEKINANWLQALQLLSQLDNRQAFSALTQSGLHLLAEKDQLVPATAAQALRELNSRQQVHVVNGAAHALHWSQPEVVCNLLRNFLLAVPLNKKLMANSFSRAASTYDSVASLQRKVGELLFNNLMPESDAQVVLDLGCGTGYFTPSLQKRFPQSLVVGLDIAEGMLQVAKERLGCDAASGIYSETRREYIHVGSTPASMRSMVSEQTPEAALERASFVCADAERLPFADQSVDIIFSNFALQWCTQLTPLFAELQRVLKPNGHLFFTTLGPQTLHELKSAWQQVDDLVHVNEFHTHEQLTQAIHNNGLQLVSCESQSEIMKFETLSDLTHSLKALGAHNVNRGRAQGLTGRQKIAAFKHAYETFRKDNLLPATYDVFYLTVKK